MCVTVYMAKSCRVVGVRSCGVCAELGTGGIF